MTRLSGFDWFALVVLVIGGLNLGLIGFFNFDLFASIFGVGSVVTRIAYAIVGLTALYIAFLAPSFEKSRTWEHATRAT